MALIHPERTTVIKRGRGKSGPVFYWMSRDQRVQDNWALLYAQELALKTGSGLSVVFCLVPQFLGASLRQYRFMLKGLAGVEARLSEKRIPFYLLQGEPSSEIPRLMAQAGVGSLVMDFDPLKIKKIWKEETVRKLDVDVYEIDAHNIVSCRFVSQKQEYAAFTLRPKINKLLKEFLTDFPPVEKQSIYVEMPPPVNWEAVEKSLNLDNRVGEVSGVKPGEDEAHSVLKGFIRNRLKVYERERNDPLKNAQSGLSPYLHFGQISAQRVALEVIRSGVDKTSKDAFLEELIVRRELSDNYCFYNPYYYSVEGFPEWARNTLREHSSDKREYIYDLPRLEEARTHDDLWNAAQTEMVVTGKMHGYLRMYWAKKILEWSRSPEEAMKAAVYLNDKYELDGRDPNGYTGVAWSIGGVHDRPWKKRNVFGSIRYMSYNGCKAKFDVDAYIRKINEIS